MGALVNLQHLDLSYNKINTIPPEFCLMKSLVSIDISFNCLESLPLNFGTFSGLHSLNASHNKMSRLPPTFRHLRCLEELYLSSNSFICLEHILFSCLSIKILHFEANRIKYLPPEICATASLEELNLRHNDIRSIPLDLAHHINSRGHRIRIDLSQNPLTDLPLKFSASEDNKTFMNPSGWNFSETLEWMNDENVIYKPAVEEWCIKKEVYMSGYLHFNNFLEGVLCRCENLFQDKCNDDRNMMFYSELLKSRKYSDILKRFFFHCKKYGYPPAYHALGSQDISSREKEFNNLEQVRKQRATNAKNLYLRRRSQEHFIYLGDLVERCAKADVIMSNVERKKNEKQKVENNEILAKVSSRFEEKSKMDEAKKIKREEESAREAKELARLSFHSHTNKKRLLPIEINPCWK